MVRSAKEWSPRFKITVAATILLGIVLIYLDLGVLAFFLFFLASIFGFGLRDKFDDETTASAYSVFNKDGRAIVGGFTANQFDRQLRGSMPNTGRTADDPLNGPIAEAAGPSNKTSSNAKIPATEREKRRKAALEAAERRLKSE